MRFDRARGALVARSKALTGRAADDEDRDAILIDTAPDADLRKVLFDVVHPDDMEQVCDGVAAMTSNALQALMMCQTPGQMWATLHLILCQAHYMGAMLERPE